MNGDNGFGTIFNPNYYEQSGSNEQDVVGNFNQFNSEELMFNSELEEGAEAAESLYLNRSILLHTMSPLLAAVTRRDAELSQHLEKTTEDAVEPNYNCNENETVTSAVCCNLIADNPILCRAKASLPRDYLILSDEDTNSTEPTVYTQRYIAHPTKFGPFVGEVRYASELDLDVLQVQTPRHYPLLILDATHILDVSNEDKTNWMRYVRLATNEMDRNLCLQLDRGNIYFRTIRPLNVGEELRVGLWQCGQCDRNFMQPNELHTHLLEHEFATGVDVCADICSDDAQSRKRSQRKLRPRPLLGSNQTKKLSVLPADELSIRCRACYKVFMTNDSLRQHMQKQHVQMKLQRRRRRRITQQAQQKQAYKTGKCAVSGISKQGITVSRPVFKCNLCSKSFRTTQRWQQHKKTHTAQREKPHVCVVCSQQCATPTALVAHLQSHAHTGYICIYCEQQYRYVRDFKQHVSSHSDADGIFHCDHCYKKYTAYHLVRKHVRIFHTARQLSCQQCSKQFSNISNLQRHKQIHSAQKQQECSICCRAFLRRDQLMAHIRRVHENKQTLSAKECSQVKETIEEHSVSNMKEMNAANTLGSSAQTPTLNAVNTLESNAPTLTVCNRRKQTPNKLVVLEDVVSEPSFRVVAPKLRDELVDCVATLNHEEGSAFVGPEAFTVDDLVECEPVFDSGRNEAPSMQLDLMPTETSYGSMNVSPLYPYKCHLCTTNASFKRRGILVNHFVKLHPHINLAEVEVLNMPLTKPRLEFPCPCCSNTYKSNAKRKSHMLKHHPAYKQSVGNNIGELLLVGSTSVDIHKCELCPRQYAARNRLVCHYHKMHPNAKPPSNANKNAMVIPSTVASVDAEDAELFLNGVDDGALLPGDVEGIETCSSVTHCVVTPFLEPEINITENKLLKLSSAALELSRFDFLNERNAGVGDELSHLSATLFGSECNASTSGTYANKVDYKTLFT